VNAELLEEIADAMVSSGLLAAGYGALCCDVPDCSLDIHSCLALLILFKTGSPSGVHCSSTWLMLLQSTSISMTA
jgi:hypothetical protein